MNTEAIKDSADIPKIKESPRSKSFNFSLDGNLGLQIGFLSGLGGILYYLFPTHVLHNGSNCHYPTGVSCISWCIFVLSFHLS